MYLLYRFCDIIRLKNPDLQKTLFIWYIRKHAGNTTAIFTEIFIDIDWPLVNGKYRKIINALRFRL